MQPGRNRAILFMHRHSVHVQHSKFNSQHTHCIAKTNIHAAHARLREWAEHVVSAGNYPGDNEGAAKPKRYTSALSVSLGLQAQSRIAAATVTCAAVASSRGVKRTRKLGGNEPWLTLALRHAANMRHECVKPAGCIERSASGKLSPAEEQWP